MKFYLPSLKDGRENKKVFYLLFHTWYIIETRAIFLYSYFLWIARFTLFMIILFILLPIVFPKWFG